MAGAASLGFGCACGRLRGAVADAAPAAVTHVVCHCGDCRSAYVHLGHTDPGPVGILQTSQDRIRITDGADQLRVFRHTPKGALRWYAACCGSPLVLTPLRARLVHAGLDSGRLDDPKAAGKVVAEGFVPSRDGRTRHRGAVRMVGRMVARILAGNLDGSWRRTPFFDADGAPVRSPTILDRAERIRILAALRG